MAELAGRSRRPPPTSASRTARLLYAPRAEGRRRADPGGAGSSAASRTSASAAATWGPHLDELKLELDGRSLRRYGSQGQQRAALLALLFAEREALLTARRVTPLLLLDDVMSELDPGRRARLVERLARGGQALITAADEESLPAPALAAVVRMPAACRRRSSRRVTRRRAPRQAAAAFRAARELVAPKTGLAVVQGPGRARSGPQLAAVASPVSERAGTLTVEVTDSVWAQELDLMQEAAPGAPGGETLGASGPERSVFRLAKDAFS